MQQRQLIIFVSLFIVASATQLNYFDAQIDLPFIPDPITIFAEQIQVWANVTDCPPPSCNCVVEVNVTTTNDSYPVTFLSNPSDIGSVTVDNLQPNTLYSFTLICVGNDSTINREIRTDYGRPSEPENINAALISKHIRFTWSYPSMPNGPIHNYKLTKDRELITDSIKNTQFSYDMTEDYIYGQTDTFFLVACNTNRRNESVCSNPNDGKVTFYLPVTTTLSPESTTKKSSSDIVSSSNVFLVSLIFFSIFK